jgi:KUP system potassium uptake protein
MRAPSASIHLTSYAKGMPPEFVKNFRHNKAIHETVVFMTILTEAESAHLSADERIEFEDLGNEFYRIVGHMGFMEEPDVPELLRMACEEHGLELDLDEATYVVGRETVLSHGKADMARWRQKMFSFMSRNAQDATAYFNLPRDRVLEIGSQIEL